MKISVAGGVYHAYNRGVEKRTMFEDEDDYRVFRHYLSSYLCPPVKSEASNLPQGVARVRASYDLHERVRLFAFCLMPNHFHLVLRQKDDLAMREFVRRLASAYVGYFNKKYERIGTLFQGTYRAVLVDSTEQLLHLSRYVHRNPVEILPGLGLQRLDQYPHSSYRDYLGLSHTPWVHPYGVLEHFRPADFGPSETYRQFVESPDAEKALTVAYCLD